jgi:DnaK suppressor protein
MYVLWDMRIVTRSENMNPKLTLISGNKNGRKAILEAKLAETLAASGQRENLDIEFQADPLDQVRAALDRDITVDQLNRQTRLSQEVRAALEKLNSSLYGMCEECEEPIAQRRLEAVPWARLCVKCQAQAEASDREDRFGNAA